VSNSSLFTPALLRTHSFSVHETRRIVLSPFISKARPLCTEMLFPRPSLDRLVNSSVLQEAKVLGRPAVRTDGRMTADSARMRSELPRRPRDWRRSLGHRAFDGELLCSIVRPTIATPPSICREDDWYRSRGMGGSSVLFSAICIHTHTRV